MASSSSNVNENNNNGHGESSRVIRVWSARDKSASEDSLVGEFKNIGLQSSMAYPVRTDTEDCRLFLRTGSCSFGSDCKYNHPMLATNKDPNVEGMSSTVNERDEAVQVSGKKKIECKYHLRPGGCKLGETCRFHHSQRNLQAFLPEVNFLELPVRPNESFRPYVYKQGYGVQATSSTHATVPRVAVGRQRPFYHHFSGQSTPRVPPMMVGSIPYTGHPYPNMAVMNQPRLMAGYDQVPAFSQNKNTEPAREIPAARPKPADLSEQPGSEAKLVAEPNPPPPRREPCALNDVDLPLRPGEEICWNYENLGLCKSGRACPFDHPAGLSAPARIRDLVSRCYLDETAGKPSPEE